MERDEEAPGGRGQHAKVTGPAAATHPVLALGIHEAGLEHIQGLAQERGASALGRVSRGQQLRLTETQMPATAMVTGETQSPACTQPHAGSPTGASVPSPASSES